MMLTNPIIAPAMPPISPALSPDFSPAGTGAGGTLVFTGVKSAVVEEVAIDHIRSIFVGHFAITFPQTNSLGC